jgi:uncharacterized Ntn-hydrolase superfamily protein
MTFSIAARDTATGMFGMAIASSSPAVAARCAHARAGVGVVASQNITDPRLGPKGLDLMAAGLGATAALDRLVATETYTEYRQLVLVDQQGITAVHSGAETLGINAAAAGPARSGVAAAGNLLADAGVPETMVAAFLVSSGHFGARLLSALRAGLDRGGEAGPVHSAGLLVVDKVPWPVVDLRVDWDDADPIGRLEALWAIYAPQIDAYVGRALAPTGAPSFGVAGDR